MSKKSNTSQSPPRNPVAKFARQFNKAAVFKDKTAYQRKPKHQHREPSLIRFVKSIREGSLAAKGPSNTQFRVLANKPMPLFE